jgi:hypothetical protein
MNANTLATVARTEGWSLGSFCGEAVMRRRGVTIRLVTDGNTAHPHVYAALVTGIRPAPMSWPAPDLRRISTLLRTAPVSLLKGYVATDTYTAR